MATYFFDTSAIGKRYIAEVGSNWVWNIVHPSAGHLILLSDLARIELLSILSRRHYQDNTLTRRNYLSTRRTVMRHMRTEYRVLPISRSVLAMSLRVVGRPYTLAVGIRTLRTLDAIQLATAIQARQAGFNITFVSADVRLLAAAQAEGFPTDDPNLHP